MEQFEFIGYNRIMIKKLIWILILVGLGFALWKAGIYFYHTMEQEEAKRDTIMQKQSQSAAEGYVNPAESSLEQKARQVERKTQDLEQNP